MMLRVVDKWIKYQQIVNKSNYHCTDIGLGLWICQKIIDLHEGTIRFSSEGHGKGTTFIVELPLFPNVRNIQ